jgi:hypothetical protein
MKKSVRKFLTGINTPESGALLDAVAAVDATVAAVARVRVSKDADSDEESDSDNYNSGNEDTDTVDDSDSEQQYQDTDEDEDEDEDIDDVLEENADTEDDPSDEEDVDVLDDADDTEHILLDSTASYSPKDLKRLKQVARACIARNEHVPAAKQLLQAISAYKNSTNDSNT